MGIDIIVCVEKPIPRGEWERVPFDDLVFPRSPYLFSRLANVCREDPCVPPLFKEPTRQLPPGVSRGISDFYGDDPMGQGFSLTWYTVAELREALADDEKTSWFLEPFKDMPGNWRVVMWFDN